jgi:asparagine synthase (glutamine-hydrolysing)
MCGIAGIILKRNGTDLPRQIAAMTRSIRHRGPDGEGFLLVSQQQATPYANPSQQFTRGDLNYIPQQPLPDHAPGTFLAFAHRRLSIIDLSDSGHQPMCCQEARYWIVFNGEIYNYIELRHELKQLGHRFISESDTEVIIASYKEWGTACVQRFNGMWAFCIYDTEKQTCFASRDRLGVKPFYYVNNKDVFAFASEQKAFIKAGLIPFRISSKALYDYLLNDQLENEPANFFEGILELWPGCNLVYDLRRQDVSTSVYYHLRNEISRENDTLSDEALIEKIGQSFERAVRLRLRSDVEVGTCLSGGIDSSALAVTIAGLNPQPLHCFTSVFRGEAINEEFFADRVAAQIGARHHKVEPDPAVFEKEIATLVYSQDVPIWSTSTYAQYKVMELARQTGIKVVLDGQGADELFAGYHHHFLAKWNNLLSKGHYLEAWKDISASGKTIPGAFSFFLKERLKAAYHFNQKHLARFFHTDFLKSHTLRNPAVYEQDVNAQLLRDIYDTRLKSFLKCEDRCGMWHSVESRTPFSDDVELINLMFSFDGNRKIRNGVSKHLLREALKDKLPREVYHRYDKKGFETPMSKWMKALKPGLMREIKEARFDFVNYTFLEKSDLSHPLHEKLIFKLFVLSLWRKAFSSASAEATAILS